MSRVNFLGSAKSFALLALPVVAASGPILAASACGPSERPDFRTSYGSAVYLGDVDAGVTPKVADDMETDLLARLASRGWSVRKMKEAMRSAEFHYVQNPFPCNVVGPSGGTRKATCDGTETDNYLKIANDPEGCPWTSAYRHELFHWIQYVAEGVDDYQHSAPEWAAVINDPVYKCHGINTP